MDVSGDSSSSLCISSESSREDTPLDADPQDNGEQSVSDDCKCRKSSRLKAKMTRQVQDVTVPSDQSDTYNLRLSSLVKRVQVERRRSTPKQPKGKSKPPPLSKYRRRTANARERMRMKDINEGFEKLRKCLPEMAEQTENKKKEKPTKFTILSLALNYIHALREILGYPEASGGHGDSLTVSCSEESDLGSDAASTGTTSVSSVSCDEVYSNPSPSSSDLKEYSLAEAPFMPPENSKVLLAECRESVLDSSILKEFRENTRSSPSSLSSDLSMSPSPPPLPLPEDCMDLDHDDLLDVSISLAALDGIDDIVM